MPPATDGTTTKVPGPMGSSPAPGNPPTPSQPSYQTQLSDFLAAERQNESGGNYTAYNAAGGASGAYQFIQPTWTSWADQAGYGQYANAPASQAPPAVQDAVAGAMASSYYQQFGGNWQDVAESWYYPAWAGNPQYQNSVPYPSAGNTLTIGQYGQNVVNAMNKLLGTSTSPAPNQNTLGAAGVIGQYNQANQAGPTYANAALGQQEVLGQAQQQITDQNLLNQLNNALAGLGIQKTGLQQQADYTNTNYALQQDVLNQNLQNLAAGYGLQQQQFGLQGQEAQQAYQNAMQSAESGLAASGVYNTGTRGVTETPIQQQLQNAMQSLGIQQQQAAQNFANSKWQLGAQGHGEALTNAYQNQQIQNALAQLGLNQTQAQQQYQTGVASAANSQADLINSIVAQQFQNQIAAQNSPSSVLQQLIASGQYTGG